MKEMVYGARQIEVLHKENYLGYDFYVVSLGTHPCIYVAIPEGHPWHGLEYTDETIDITPHCGFTFSGVLDVCDNKWCLGWDYAHCDDFYYPVWQAGKKWSTSELIEEAHKTIEQFPGNRGTLYVAGQQLRRAWIDFVGEVKTIWWDVVFCIVMIVAVVALLVFCTWHRELALTICNIFNLITWIMNLFSCIRFRHLEGGLR